MARWPLFSLLFLLFSACEKPLRLPYITPELHNWPKVYKGVSGLRLHVFNTGSLEVRDRLVYRNGSPLDTVSLDIQVFVIEHPRYGLIVVGTGVNRASVDDVERHLGLFRASAGTPVIAKDQDILAQLKQAKLPSTKVHYIILPDLQLDHAGELQSFPAAQPIVTAAEYEAAMAAKDNSLYVSEEYANVREWQFVDFAGAQPLGIFRAHRDLFNDGSVLLIDASGATAGGLAVLVRLPAAPVLLCGNLAWTKEQYVYTRLPGLLFDREAWWDKIWRLKKFKDVVPELAVFPDHDWAAVAAAKTKDVVLHPFSVTEETPAEEDQSERSPKPKAKSNKPQKRKAHRAPQEKPTHSRIASDHRAFLSPFLPVR